MSGPTSILAIASIVSVLGLCTAAVPVCGGLGARRQRSTRRSGGDHPTVRWSDTPTLGDGVVTLELRGGSTAVARLVLHVSLYGEDGAEACQVETRPRALMSRQAVREQVCLGTLAPGTYRAAVLVEADGVWSASWHVWTHPKDRVELVPAA